MDWIEVRRDGHLLFRFCPAKRLIEIRRNGDTHVVDLDEMTPKERPSYSGRLQYLAASDTL